MGHTDQRIFALSDPPSDQERCSSSDLNQPSLVDLPSKDLALERFYGKVVIVTGAASGIFHRGSQCRSRRSQLALAKIVQDLPKERTLAYPADVSRSDMVDAMVSVVVERFGRLDILINNAGIHEGGEPTEITDDKWRKVMSTDADGVFYGCRAAIPHLVQSKGCIVHTASVSGTGGDWAMSPYNAAKGAVVNLTRALALGALKAPDFP